MINYIMKKYALSRQGAKDLIVATISCVVHNLMLMLPVSLLYFLVSDLYEGGVPQSHLWIYIVGMIAGVLLILFSYRWVYGATYYATYKESSVRRISLAEITGFSPPPPSTRMDSLLMMTLLSGLDGSYES